MQPATNPTERGGVVTQREETEMPDFLDYLRATFGEDAVQAALLWQRGVDGRDARLSQFDTDELEEILAIVEWEETT